MRADETTTPPPQRAPIGAVVVTGVLLAVALFAGALVVWLSLTVGDCGGDGGSPYAAPASPRGRYCESGGPELSLVVGAALPVIGAVLAAVRGRWLPLVVAAVAAVVLLVSPLVIASALPRECADEPDSMTGPQLLRYLREHPRCGHY
jgi:hypothetical protein